MSIMSRTPEEILNDFFNRPNKAGPWAGPRRKATPIYVGETYTPGDVERHQNGAALGRRDKPGRRLLRALIRKRNSRIEHAVVLARRANQQFERLATNSHEAKRYVAAGRLERIEAKRAKAQWTAAWLTAWRGVGQSYAHMKLMAERGANV